MLSNPLITENLQVSPKNKRESQVLLEINLQYYLWYCLVMFEALR